jgi:glycosyltransferase involved in cell wall biosynthesis
VVLGEAMNLSVLIPARNEEWLNLTVQDVLDNIRGDSEVIVIADGAWPIVPLPQHPRLQVIKTPSSIGQRAATNLAAKISQARYILKLDAHCRVSEGFDKTLTDWATIMGPNVCTIPAQYNLHVFDWVCTVGHRVYQGPTPVNGCTWKPKSAKAENPICGKPTHRDIIWKKRESRLTTAWRFDRDLHFQYWGEYQRQNKEPIHDVMSCLGACWLVNREHFLSLGGLDEDHGSWGQMGTELACKYWLSGGRMVVNKHAWFAHLFRTQGGDFSFPYPISGEQQDTARKRSAWLWKEGNWPLAQYDLRWLVEKFNPPGWSQGDIDALPRCETHTAMDESSVVRSVDASVSASTPYTRPDVRAVGGKPSIGAVWYTDNRANSKILRSSLDYLSAIPNLDLIRVGIRESEFVDQVLPNRERGYLTMFEQILAGLEALDTDVAFLCEHDVLYHPSHFELVPTEGKYCYNINTWKVDVVTGKAVTYITKQTSGLFANRQLLIEHYRKRISRVRAEGFTRKMGFEPGSHNRKERVDDIWSIAAHSRFPNIDLRHDKNLTSSRWSPDQFRDKRNCQGWEESTASAIPGWPDLTLILQNLR